MNKQTTCGPYLQTAVILHIMFGVSLYRALSACWGHSQPGESGRGLELIPGAWAEGIILAWGVGRIHQFGPGGDATLGLDSWEGDLLGSGGSLILDLMKKIIGDP